MQHQHLDSNFMAKDVGSKIPKGMLVSFYPTSDMEINGLHLAITFYIFNIALDQEEILVSNSHCAMTRKALRTLGPGKQVVDDTGIDSACKDACIGLHKAVIVPADNL
ncbi:hypothetical protein AHAS_Ahas17G0096400 [Arachis hypogaea]